MTKASELERPVVVSVTLTDGSKAIFRLRFEGDEAVVDTATSDPDIEVSLTESDAVAIRSGGLSPSVAYMQGRLKPSGNMTQLLALLAWAEAHPHASAGR